MGDVPAGPASAIKERSPEQHRFSNRRPPIDPAQVVVAERCERLERRGGEVSAQQIAWAAGLYEGEGSCSPNSHNHARIGARVVQKDTWVLERLKGLFGGSIGEHRTTLHDRNFMGAVWHVSGPRARGFLMTVYPFLSPWRRSGARTALTRTSHAVATAEFCRRGHSVRLWAGQQAGGRYCRRCKNETANRRYQEDARYRRRLLDRMNARRRDRRIRERQV